MLNAPSVFEDDEIFNHVNVLTGASHEEVKAEWDSLCNRGIIVKTDYQHSVNHTYLSEVKETLSQSLTLKSVNADDIRNHIDGEISNNPEKQRAYVALLGRLDTRENVKYVAFSDWEWMNDPGPLCDDLVKLRVTFLGTSSSRKHYYRFYYLRRWPFDGYEMLSNIVLKHLKIEGLSDNEWHVLFHLLFSRTMSLPYETLKTSLDMTEAELRECISILKEKGHLVEQQNAISVVQGARLPLLQYFKENIYPRLKGELVSRTKRKITEGLSNLYPLMFAKRINELPVGDTRQDIIRLKIVRRTELPQPEQITDLARLGLVLDLGDNIVVLLDVVKEIENWIKGSLNSSLTLIPAEDSYFAHTVLKDMFTRCESYIKIQDPYIGEDAFRIISSYVPKDVEVRILTGQELGKGEIAEDIYRYVERLKSERKGKFQIMFIGSKNKEAPFHDRFIISEARCWTIGTSLKQVGKGKDTTVVEVPLLEKDEKIEPAFDWNWSAKKEALEKKGFIRLDFDEWKATMET
jgi:hypothetical protein